MSFPNPKTCGLFFVLAAALPACLPDQSPSADSTSDAEISRQYEQRRESVIDKQRVLTDPKLYDARYVAAADFYRGANLDGANAQTQKIAAGRQSGDMFWMFPMVALMEAGRDGMTAANRARLRDLWRTYFPYRGDTENHWLIYYASLCLAAEANPSAGPEAWYNGKSSAENIAEARSYIEDWMNITVSRGQGEFDSPNYLEEYTAPLALLAGWERDPKFRQEARMMLDYIFFDYAVDQLNGSSGGAHSRVYPDQVLQPGQTPAAAIGWLLFGLGEYSPRSTVVILALSGYRPPAILDRIAHDRSRPYVDRELKRTRWQMRFADPDTFPIEGKATEPVYKYTYMNPDFVIGSCQGGLLQPIQQQSWSLLWREAKTLNRENTFFGLQPSSSAREGMMYFAWARPDTFVNGVITGPNAKADYDSPDKLEGGSPYEQILQNGPALIALYDIPRGARFPGIDTFFSRDLAHRDQDKSGWIFCQGGPAYFAYRPFAPGEWKPWGWTGVMKGGKGGWFSPGFFTWGRNNHCFVSGSLKNGYIVQAASASEYKSFDQFKGAVRALPVRFALEPTPEASFTALDGANLHARYGGVPEVNGKAVDRSHWPLFDNPYGHALRDSRRLEISYGDERYLLDFQNATIEESVAPGAP